MILPALRSRNYRLFFGGQGLSLIGTWMQRLAMSWLVYRLTDSAFFLGFVGFTSQIPVFFVAPFAGVLADRMNRRRILVMTQVCSLLQAVILTVLVLADAVTVWHLIALSLFLGLVDGFDMPVRQSFMVEIVQAGDLGNAIALNASIVNGAQLLGPSIAGVLIASAGEGVCFLLNAISYLFVIFSLLAMKTDPPKKGSRNADVLRGIKEGFSYGFGFAPIRLILLLMCTASLFGLPYKTLMPVFARDVLHGDSHSLGFLMGSSGVGALVGAIYLASRKSVLGLGKWIPLAAGLFGVGIIGFSLSRVFWVSMVLVFLAGFGMLVQMASSNSILQTVADEDKRGRVMSLYAMSLRGMVPFGSLLAGSVASKIGAPNTLLLGGAFCIFAAFLFARKLPALREMVRPIYFRMGILPGEGRSVQKEPI